MKLASLAKKSKYGEREKNNSISLKYGPDHLNFSDKDVSFQIHIHSYENSVLTLAAFCKVQNSFVCSSEWKFRL